MIRYRSDRPSPWLAEVRGPDGRRVTRSFTSESKAKRWEEDQRAAIRRYEWVDPSKSQIRVSDWLAEVEASKLRISDTTRTTRGYMIRHINRDLGDWPLGRLTAEAIQRWVADISTTLSPATVRKAHAILGEALTLAAARGRIARNPNLLIELPRPVEPDHRYLTDPELHSLAEAMAPRYRPFVYLGGYAGLRPGESLAAEWGDISGQTLRVRGTKTKASRRSVRIPPILSLALAEHRQAFPHVRWILHNSRGHQVRIDTFRNRQWRDAVEQTVGEPMRPYDLRHTHVALLIAEGAHAKVIADRLGHTTIRTTMDCYGHLLEGVGDDLIDGLGRTNDDHSAGRSENGA